MFGLFKRRSEPPGGTPSLDSVRFDVTGWDYRGEPRPGQVRVWFTPEGDGVGLYFFAVPPDLPTDARSADDLRAFYARGLEPSGGRLVEVSLPQLDGTPAIRVLFKVPQQPTGLTYVGSLTLPFREFSFVVKAQCEERGPTGFREAVLLDRRVAAGDVPGLSEGRMDLPGWNPDDERFDPEFPEHPAARVRKVLQHVAASLVIEDSIKALPGFPLPHG